MPEKVALIPGKVVARARINEKMPGFPPQIAMITPEAVWLIAILPLIYYNDSIGRRVSDEEAGQAPDCCADYRQAFQRNKEIVF